MCVVEWNWKWQLAQVLAGSNRTESSDSDAPDDNDTDGRVRETEVQVIELSEALDELKSETVHTIDHYNHKIRECCMKLKVEAYLQSGISTTMLVQYLCILLSYCRLLGIILKLKSFSVSI